MKVASNSQVSPLTRLLPPRGRISRLKYYTRRYGLVHAGTSFVGRYFWGFWNFVGPFVTRSYLKRWLASANPKILNLGGGNIICEQWLAADVTARADVYMDVTQPLPIPDNYLDAVYSEEVIEHIDRRSGERMLREIYRVLRPGGVLRLTTPKLEYFAHRALADSQGFHEINAIFYGHDHRCIYTTSALKGALQIAGFINIVESTYRDSDSKYGRFDSHPERVSYAPPEWSQFWEGEKPFPTTH